MMEFGKSLRAAREAKGFTVLQLAETTHLAPSVVENLENEDFSHIAAPIYGRGFVKLYCEAVGLAPKPMIDQFMDLLNGTTEPRIRERPVAPEAPAATSENPPVTEPEDEPIPEPPPQQDLFRSQTPLDERRDLPPASAPAAPVSAPEDEPAMSKYASPFRMAQNASTQRVWRTGVLALIAFAVILLLFFGLKALYRATSSGPAPEKPETTAPAATAQAETTQAKTAQAETTSAKEKTPATPRTAQDIPSLYID